MNLENHTSFLLIKSIEDMTERLRTYLYSCILRSILCCFSITQQLYECVSYYRPDMLEGVRVCSFDLRNNHLISLPEAVYRPIIDFTAASAVFWTTSKILGRFVSLCSLSALHPVIFHLSMARICFLFVGIVTGE